MVAERHVCVATRPSQLLRALCACTSRTLTPLALPAQQPARRQPPPAFSCSDVTYSVNNSITLYHRHSNLGERAALPQSFTIAHNLRAIFHTLPYSSTLFHTLPHSSTIFHNLPQSFPNDPALCPGGGSFFVSEASDSLTHASRYTVSVNWSTRHQPRLPHFTSPTSS